MTYVSAKTYYLKLFFKESQNSLFCPTLQDIYWCMLSVCYSFLAVMLKLSYPQLSFTEIFEVK